MGVGVKVRVGLGDAVGVWVGMGVSVAVRVAVGRALGVAVGAGGGAVQAPSSRVMSRPTWSRGVKRGILGIGWFSSIWL